MGIHRHRHARPNVFPAGRVAVNGYAVPGEHRDVARLGTTPGGETHVSIHRRAAPPGKVVAADVKRALQEDLGTGDCTAALVPEDNTLGTRVVCRDQAICAGRPWFDETFRQLGGQVTITWVTRNPTAGLDHQVRTEVFAVSSNTSRPLSDSARLTASRTLPAWVNFTALPTRFEST